MSEPIRKERTYCPHCGSGWEPYFSSYEPMGFSCRDCGKDVDDKTAISNTPRTDKETGISIGSGSIVFASFTRQLERELTEAREQRDRLAEALEMVRDADNDCYKDGLPTMPPSARQKIDKALASVK